MKRNFIFAVILMALLIYGCAGPEDSMTKLDQEFDGYANDAAEQFLEQEADKNSFSVVKTGELEYRYTFYNEELNVYEVGYLAEFNEEDEEEQWIEIFVVLNGDTKSVEDISCAFWDSTSYEMNYNLSYGARNDKDDEWRNINLLEEKN